MVMLLVAAGDVHMHDPARKPLQDTMTAIRLGLNRVKGMGLEAAIRIAEAREIAPFENPDDLANRASLNTAEIRALATADALRTLSGHRRQTLWTVASYIAQRDLPATPCYRQRRHVRHARRQNRGNERRAVEPDHPEAPTRSLELKASDSVRRMAVRKRCQTPYRQTAG